MTVGGGLSDGLRNKYRGLFSPRNAPTARAYCTLFSFTGGIVLVTAGSVFCSVISRHPVSGGHPMHTPPLPLAVLIILAGVGLMVTSVVTIWRYGIDDGDDTFEEDLQHFCCDDQLDLQHRQHLETLQQQLLLQRYIEQQLQQSRVAACPAAAGNCCSHRPHHQCQSIYNPDVNYDRYQSCQQKQDYHCCSSSPSSNNECYNRCNTTVRKTCCDAEIQINMMQNDSAPVLNNNKQDSLENNFYSKPSTSSTISSCVYKPASVKIGSDSCATVYTAPVSQDNQSKWQHILGGDPLTSSKGSGNLSKSQRVSSVIMSNNNAVKVVLDGS